MMKLFAILALFVLFALSNIALAGDDDEELKSAYGKAVAGDIRPVLLVLRSVEDPEHSKHADLYNKYKNRFVDANEQVEFGDPFITRLYTCYADYWRSSLLDPKDEKPAKQKLFRKLKKLSKKQGRKTGLFEFFTGPKEKELEEFLINTAKDKGYFVLMGQTAPLRELMIWKKEENEIYEIDLPSGRLSMKVVFAQDFLSYGWLGYATFNRNHTGGWNTGEITYRVGKKPDKDDEWFRVSLLGHEGQHEYDKSHYEGLDGWVFEYRAKLTELLLADHTFWKLLTQFQNEAQNNSSIPHVYASYLLIQNLVGEISPEEKRNAFDFRFKDHSEDKLQAVLKTLYERSNDSLKCKQLSKE